MRAQFVPVVFAPIAYIAMLFGSQALAEDLAGVTAFVDLDRPGVMETLAERNPVHYHKVVAILTEIRTKPVAEVPQWLRASFDAREVTYSSVLLVSNPPKRDLSFVLGITRYKARVTLEWVTLESVH